MNQITAFLDLPVHHVLILGVICFMAGLVRGFSGFALSAFVVACAALIVPPVSLIPVLWWLEITASILMVKNSLQQADRAISLRLIAGSAIGVPIGLALTVSVLPDTSRFIAFMCLIVLAALQLAKIRFRFLATTPGVYGAGVASGIATGLAGVGGMVVAIYVLSQNRPAHVMRASLVLYLFGASVISFVMHTSYGIMDQTAVLRGVFLALPTALGVYLGQKLFTPRFAQWYKPICLTLLIGLSGMGIIRLMVG